MTTTGQNLNLKNREGRRSRKEERVRRIRGKRTEQRGRRKSEEERGQRAEGTRKREREKREWGIGKKKQDIGTRTTERGSRDEDAGKVENDISTYLRGAVLAFFRSGGTGAWMPGVLGLGARVQDWVSRVQGRDSGVFSSGAYIPSSLAPGSSEVGGFSPPLSV